MLLAEGRQVVVIINHILGMIDTLQVFAWQAEPFGALRTGGDKDRLKAQARRSSSVRSPCAPTVTFP
jgi:hypothetical protein